MNMFVAGDSAPLKVKVVSTTLLPFLEHRQSYTIQVSSPASHEILPRNSGRHVRCVCLVAFEFQGSDPLFWQGIVLRRVHKLYHAKCTSERRRLHRGLLRGRRRCRYSWAHHIPHVECAYQRTREHSQGGAQAHVWVHAQSTRNHGGLGLFVGGLRLSFPTPRCWCLLLLRSLPHSLPPRTFFRSFLSDRFPSPSVVIRTSTTL